MPRDQFWHALTPLAKAIDDNLERQGDSRYFINRWLQMSAAGKQRRRRELEAVVTVLAHVQRRLTELVERGLLESDLPTSLTITPNTQFRKPSLQQPRVKLLQSAVARWLAVVPGDFVDRDSTF
jgi:hypothetical protein